MATATSTAPELAWTKKISGPQELAQYRQTLVEGMDPSAPRIRVCCGTGCKAVGSLDVLEALKTAVAAAGVDVKVVPEIKRTGCHGFCSRGPLLTLQPQDLFYQRVKPEDTEEIVRKTVVGGEVIPRFLYKPPGSKETIANVHDIPFFAKQTKLVLKRVGRIDPFDIRDAIADGAYQGLAKILTEMTPQQVIEEIKVARLRGRGGAGFPTGIKWESCASQPGRHYVICNGDEGDPGAFMDAFDHGRRSACGPRGHDHRRHAVGANEGYIYVRDEYPLAVKNLTAPSPGRGARACSATTSWAAASASTSVSAAAAALSCAASLRP